MAERVSWAVSHSPGVITTVDARHVVGSMMWPGSSAVNKRSGRVPKLNLDAFNVTATGTPDGFVHVAPGHMWTMGTRSIAPYIQTLDAIKDINILATPAHATLTRWDLVIAQQNDELHADADNTWTIKAVAGTPAASPVDPTVTGSPDFVTLARVVVGPTVTTITNANITQLLVAHTVPVGALLPTLNQTERDAMTGTRYDGMPVWRRDIKRVEVYDGTNWLTQGLFICTAATRPGAPYQGQEIYETDTRLRRFWNGTAWACAVTQEFHARATSDLTITAVEADVPGAFVTFTTLAANATATFLGVFELREITTVTSYIRARYQVDGVTGAPETLEVTQAVAEDRKPLVLQDKVTLATPGSHTIKLRGIRDDATGSAIYVGGAGGGTSIRVTLSDW